MRVSLFCGGFETRPPVVPFVRDRMLELWWGWTIHA
jgi:hypothetical protein